MKREEFKKIFRDQVFLELSQVPNTSNNKFRQKIKSVTNSLIELSIKEIDDDNLFATYLDNYYSQRRTYLNGSTQLKLNGKTIDDFINGKMKHENIEMNFYFDFSPNISFHLLHNKNNYQYIPAVKSSNSKKDEDILVCAGIIISLNNNIFRAHGLFYANDIDTNPNIN